jgi:hypothetical protein
VTAAQELAAVRAQLADLADQVARIAEALLAFDQHVNLVEIMKAVHEVGWSDARAAADAGNATARAHERRAQFQVLPGGSRPKAAPGRRTRKPAGGAS